MAVILISTDRVIILSSIPPSINGATVKFTRETWPVGPVATVTGEISFDNQAHWQPFFFFGLSGGITMRKGSPVLESSLSQTWPGENDGAGGRRLLKGTDVRITIHPIVPFSTDFTVTTF